MDINTLQSQINTARNNTADSTSADFSWIPGATVPDAITDIATDFWPNATLHLSNTTVTTTANSITVSGTGIDLPFTGLPVIALFSLESGALDIEITGTINSSKWTLDQAILALDSWLITILPFDKGTPPTFVLNSKLEEPYLNFSGMVSLETATSGLSKVLGINDLISLKGSVDLFNEGSMISSIDLISGPIASVDLSFLPAQTNASASIQLGTKLIYSPEVGAQILAPFWELDTIFSFSANGTNIDIPLGVQFVDLDTPLTFKVNPTDLIDASLDDIGALMKGNSLTTLLSPLALDLGDTIQVKKMEMDVLFSKKPQLQRITVDISSTAVWNLFQLPAAQPTQYFAISNLELEVVYTSSLWFQLSGTAKIGTNGALNTSFSHSTGSSTIFAGLADKATIKLPELWSDFVAQDTSEAPDLSITDLTFGYDTGTKDWNFSIEIDDTWMIASGLGVWQLVFAISKSASETAISADGQFILGGVEFALHADYSKVGQDKQWAFTGQTIDNAVIPIGDLAQDLVSLFGDFDLPDSVKQADLSDVSIKFSTESGATTSENINIQGTFDFEEISMQLSLAISKTGADYTVDASTLLMIGAAQFTGTFLSDEDGKDIQFSWQESDGGSISLSNFFNSIDATDFAKDVSNIELGLKEVKFTIGKDSNSILILSLNATLSDDLDAFIYAEKKDSQWSCGIGIGVNSTDAENFGPASKATTQLGSGSLNLYALLLDSKQPKFTIPDDLTTYLQGISTLQFSEGISISLVAKLPISTANSYIDKNLNKAHNQDASQKSLYAGQSTATNLLLSISFEDSNQKTGLEMEFTYPGAVTLGGTVSLGEVLFTFTISDADTMSLTLKGTLALNVTKFKGDNPLFSNHGLFTKDEIDITISADIDIAADSIDFELTGMIEAKDNDTDVALLHALPGLWIGNLEFLIGIGGDDEAPLLGIGAEVKISASVGSPTPKPPTFSAGSPGDNKPMPGGAFLIMVEMEGDAPVPIYLAMKEDKLDHGGTLFTLFTGKAPDDKTLDPGWTVLKDVLDVVCKAGNLLLKMEEMYIYYNDPDTTRTLVLPDGSRPQYEGIGFQAEVKFMDIVDAYLCLGIDSSIPSITAEAIVKGFQIIPKIGPFTIAAPSGKGMAFPSLNKIVSSGSLSSIENPDANLPISTTKGGGDNPYILLDTTTRTFAGAFEIALGDSGATKKDSALVLEDSFKIKLTGDNAGFEMDFKLALDLIDAVEDLVNALTSHLGVFGDIIGDAADWLLSMFGKIIDPSIDMTIKLEITDTEFDFDLSIYEFGLNDELKAKFHAPTYPHLSIKIDLTETDPLYWVAQLIEQIGENIWDWFKDILVDDVLAAIGKFALKMVMAVAKVFAAIANQEWDGIKDIGEGLGDAFKDLFTGNFGNIGADMEKIGEGFATITGFGTSVSYDTQQYPFNGIYLAPGGQISLTMFETFKISQHHVFFFNSSKDVDDEGPTFAGNISSYDDHRSIIEQKRFVHLLHTLKMRKYKGTNDPLWHILGQRTELYLTHEDGSFYVDDQKRKLRLAPGGVQFYSIPGRALGPGDQGVNYPYMAPSAEVSFAGNKLKTGAHFEDGDAAHWFIMPALYQDTDQDKVLYSILFSSVDSIKEYNNVLTARKAKATQEAAAAQQNSSGPCLNLSIATVLPDSQAQLISAFKNAYQNLAPEADVLSAIKKNFDNLYNFFYDQSLFHNIDPESEFCIEIGQTQANIFSHVVPEQLSISPTILESNGLNDFTASYDGFWLAVDKENDVLTARRLANATIDQKGLDSVDLQNLGVTDSAADPSNLTAADLNQLNNSISQADIDQVNKSIDTKNDPSASLDSYPLGTTNTFTTGTDLLKSACFYAEEVTDLDEDNKVQSAIDFTDVAAVTAYQTKNLNKRFILRSYTHADQYITWNNNQLTLSTDKSAAVYFTSKDFGTPPAPRIQELPQDQLVGTNNWPTLTSDITIINNSSQRVYFSFPNNVNGQIFSNQQVIVAGGNQDFSGTNPKVFALLDANHEIIKTYEVTSSDPTGVTITDELVSNTLVFSFLGTGVQSIKGNALAGIIPTSQKIVLDVLNKTSNTVELWVADESGNWTDTGFSIPSNQFVHWEEEQSYNLLALKKGASFMAIYKVLSSKPQRLLFNNTQPLDISALQGAVKLPIDDFLMLLPQKLALTGVNFVNNTSDSLQILPCDKNGIFIIKSAKNLSAKSSVNFSIDSQNPYNLLAVFNPGTNQFVGFYEILKANAQITINSSTGYNLAAFNINGSVNRLKGTDFLSTLPESRCTQQQKVCFWNNTSEALTLSIVNSEGHICPIPSSMNSAAASQGVRVSSNTGIILSNNPGQSDKVPLRYLCVATTEGFVGYYQLTGDGSDVRIIQTSTDLLIIDNTGTFANQVSLHPEKYYQGHSLDSFDQINYSINVFNANDTDAITLAGLSANGGVDPKYDWCDLIPPKSFGTIKTTQPTLPNWLVIGDNNQTPQAVVQVSATDKQVVRFIYKDGMTQVDLVELTGGILEIDLQQDSFDPSDLYNTVYFDNFTSGFTSEGFLLVTNDKIMFYSGLPIGSSYQEISVPNSSKFSERNANMYSPLEIRLLTHPQRSDFLIVAQETNLDLLIAYFNNGEFISERMHSKEYGTGWSPDRRSPILFFDKNGKLLQYLKDPNPPHGTSGEELLSGYYEYFIVSDPSSTAPNALDDVESKRGLFDSRGINNGFLSKYEINKNSLRDPNITLVFLLNSNGTLFYKEKNNDKYYNILSTSGEEWESIDLPSDVDHYGLYGGPLALPTNSDNNNYFGYRYGQGVPDKNALGLYDGTKMMFVSEYEARNNLGIISWPISLSWMFCSDDSNGIFYLLATDVSKISNKNSFSYDIYHHDGTTNKPSLVIEGQEFTWVTSQYQYPGITLNALWYWKNDLYILVQYQGLGMGNQTFKFYKLDLNGTRWGAPEKGS